MKQKSHKHFLGKSVYVSVALAKGVRMVYQGTLNGISDNKRQIEVVVEPIGKILHFVNNGNVHDPYEGTMYAGKNKYPIKAYLFEKAVFL